MLANSILNKSRALGSGVNRRSNEAFNSCEHGIWMNLIRKHWFLVSLLVLMVIGFWFAAPLEPISNVEWLKWSIVTLTMYLMAWPLEFGRIKRAVAQPLAPLLGCALNLILIPLLIWPLASLAGPELSSGMIIAAATPSTLASAAVLTRYAGGDDSVAILTTIITNASCFLVMPFWIYVQTGNEIPSAKLVGTIYKLLLFVVLPICFAQLVRIHQPSAAWATRYKPRLSRIALMGILSMVFLGAIKMGLRLNDQSDASVDLTNLVVAACVLLGVHTLIFWFGIYAARKMGAERGAQIAVGFSGSQKTLMIGLSTAVDLGMSMIPIVMYHALQLIADSIFAERIRDQEN